MEEFRVIQGYENYSVSNLGNVINNKSKYILKPFKKNGYLYIAISIAGKNKHLRVHRLVGLAFILNPANKPSIDHVDNDRTNNNVSNLRWATIQENNRNRNVCNRLGLKGVYECRLFNNSLIYNAYIGFNGKSVFIGAFNTLEEAKQARQKKANELFGEFTNQCEKIVKDTKIKVDNIIDEANDELRRLEEEFTSKFGN